MENQSIENDSMTHKNCCFSYRYKYFPILIILFGVLFLGRALEWWSYDAVDIWWPVLVIIIGLMKMAKSKKHKCC